MSSNNRFEFNGLEELIQALRSLPADLTDEASVIVQSHAYTAAQAIRDEYGRHRHSGDLADHVLVESNASQFGVGMVVRSKSRHAWLFDNGSQARHWVSGKSTGTMPAPATPTFIPTMMRFRRSMYLALADLMRTHGLVVTGRAESGNVAA